MGQTLLRIGPRGAQPEPAQTELRRAAEAHRRAGRMDEAIALLRQGVARAPRDPAAWAALA
ncbi:MAG: tetratricopeptide repeat protein, partial [Caulobacteraceae bacterium]